MVRTDRAGYAASHAQFARRRELRLGKAKSPRNPSRGLFKGLREPRRVATAAGGRKPFKRSPGSVRGPGPGPQTKKPGAPHHAGTPGDARANAPRILSTVGR